MATRSTRNAAAANADTETESTATATGEKMKLKLVGAATYHCHAVRDDVINRNEIIEVDPVIGNQLLDDVYTDGLNNEHPYFVETSDEEEAAKAKRASRRAAATASDEDSDSAE